MKTIGLYLFFWFLHLLGSAQTDTIPMADTTRHIKEAPPALKKLLEEVTAQKQATTSQADIEIDGLLFDETRTKNGRDFYSYFFTSWEAPPEARNYAIYIGEKPYRLMTTLIEIHINEILVFQAYLQPNAGLVEQLALQAVEQTRLYLANYQQLIKQLEGEDQSGSGIY